MNRHCLAGASRYGAVELRLGRARVRLALLVAAMAALCTPATRAQDPENCLFCHQFPGLSRFDPDTQSVRLFFVDPEYVHEQRGSHARLKCTDCHEAAAAAVVPHRPMPPVDCARACHLESPDHPPQRFSHANVAEMLNQSVHRPATLRDLKFSTHEPLGAQQSVCLYCHDEPLFRNPRTELAQRFAPADHATDRCDVCHQTQLPVDSAFFLRHVGARLQPARSALEQAQVCAVCHSDPKITAEHDLPNAVASFVRSFHGKAALLGDTETASCVDCHVAGGANVHLMLGPTDPRSAVHRDRVADSCRNTNCHPGADPSFGAAAVHLDLPTSQGTVEYILAILFIILTALSFGPSCLIVLLELAQLVVGRHAPTSHQIERIAEAVLRHPEGARRLHRFSALGRFQHWVLTVLFTLLCLTGFPMKFAEQAWAATMVGWFGGLATARIVHHWSGIALVIGFAAHLALVMAGVFQRARLARTEGRADTLLGTFMSLPFVVSPADSRKAIQLVAYLFGFRAERPMFGRFTTTEKFEYFGVLWGTTLLGITGLMLWGEQLASHILGGRVFTLAGIIHTYEAFLAVIHVGILHIYNVVLNPVVFPLSLATLTGSTPVTKLAEEHGEFVLETARELHLMPEEPMLE